MDQESSFLSAIESSPDDPVHRLVYADWLEDRGDPRGEFIRIVHEMSQTDVRTGLYRRLRFRREEIWKALDPQWARLILRPSPKTVRALVTRLSGLDRYRELFDAENHQYLLNPPLSNEELESVEALIGCSLPESYRYFVTEIADGGAGPAYGILPLRRLLEKEQDSDWISELTEPFPAPTNETEALDLYEDAEGALRIVEFEDEGVYHLVLVGPQKGTVWMGSRELDWCPMLLDLSRAPAGEYSLSPDQYKAALTAPQNQRLDFLDWYVQWLDHSLWAISNRYTPAPQLFDLSPTTTEVSATFRKLEATPDTLRGLRKLQSLNLASNQITVLPRWIGELKDLEDLNVNHNPVKVLPTSIGNLSRLKKLSCAGGESLQALPEEIGQLTELIDLDLERNQIPAIPNSIGDLVQLQKLDLKRNQITAVPASISGLQNCREMDLSYNQLKDLPEELGELSTLEELTLTANPLSRLPNSITRLQALRSLSLGLNSELNLVELFQQLQHLPNLRTLRLNNCKISQLPDEIGLLTQLSWLDLMANRLTTLPNTISQLSQLESISVGNQSPPSGVWDEVCRLLPHLDPYRASDVE